MLFHLSAVAVCYAGRTHLPIQTCVCAAADMIFLFLTFLNSRGGGLLRGTCWPGVGDFFGWFRSTFNGMILAEESFMAMCVCNRSNSQTHATNNNTSPREAIIMIFRFKMQICVNRLMWIKFSIGLAYVPFRSTRAFLSRFSTVCV